MENPNEGKNGVPVVHGGRRKRMAEAGPGEEQPPAPAKKRRGTLQITEMPKDMLFKIFGLLEPLDLLYLARTSKSLRKLLMTRSSSSLWRTARSNVPGPRSPDKPSMPDCPADLSEPQYAALAFGDDCSFCGHSSEYLAIWAARLRSCFCCEHYENHFIPKSSCKPSKNCPVELIRCLPTDQDGCVPIKIKLLWEGEYKTAKKKKDWLIQNEERQKIIETHAEACNRWHVNLDLYRKEEITMLIRRRKSAVVEYIALLGWGEELSKMSRHADQPQDSNIVSMACNEPLRLSRLETFTNEFMGDVKAKRLLQEHEAFLVEFKQVYEAFIATLPSSSLYPTIGDVFQDPVIRRIIGSEPVPPTSGSTTSFVSLFPAVLRRWQRSVEDKLGALVASACGDEHASGLETAIDLATSWFTCSKCNSLLRYPPILLHNCATLVDVDWVGAGPDAQWAIVRRLFQQVPWNSLGFITFESNVFACMTKVLEICGVDSKTTTAQEMDDANRILECLACNDHYEGRPAMTWSRALDHWHHIHAEKCDMKLEVLGDQETTLAQGQMRELQARRRAKRDYKGLVCTHCKLVGNMVDLTKHLNTSHGLPQPTDKDLVPILDEDHVPDIYWLWPPRKESVPASRLARLDDGMAAQPLLEDDMYL